MNKIRVNLVIFSVVAALLALLVIQFIQTAQLYDRKSTQFASKVKTALERISVRHEKAEDVRRYLAIVNRDFKGSYIDLLKEEFQNLLSPQESIIVKDTTITENGLQHDYLLIRGLSMDSITGKQREQSVLARNVEQLDELRTPSHLKNDSVTFALRLDQRVMQKLFRKAKFVNELMMESFRNTIYDDPALRIDIDFLDSIIKKEMQEDKLPEEYRFVITDEKGEKLLFRDAPVFYDTTLVLNETKRTYLFPGHSFDERIFIYLDFPGKQKILYKEMWAPFLTSLLLVILIISALIFLFRTILTQKKLFELKNDFISNMTHEFKTPISTISLACQAMKDADVMGFEVNPRDPYINIILTENQRLENLVEQILQSAALERGEREVDFEEVIINELIYNLAEETRFRVLNLNGKVDVVMPDEIFTLYTDRLHLSNIIQNLVDNAVKYSKEKPEIKIELRKSGKNYIISVSDKGIGMKKEHINRIFDKLYRIPTGNVHNVKGFGLGLSYVKAICDLHGWDISVQSTINEGSEFTLTINSRT